MLATRNGRILLAVSTVFGRLDVEMRNETMHRMNGSDITFKLGRTRMPLIGDFRR